VLPLGHSHHLGENTVTCSPGGGWRALWASGVGRYPSRDDASCRCQISRATAEAAWCRLVFVEEVMDQVGPVVAANRTDVREKFRDPRAYEGGRSGAAEGIQEVLMMRIMFCSEIQLGLGV